MSQRTPKALKQSIRDRAFQHCEYCGVHEDDAVFNPRQDNWHEHFQLRGGRIIPLTAIGRVTVRLLQFNRPEAVMSRQSPTT